MSQLLEMVRGPNGAALGTGVKKIIAAAHARSGGAPTPQYMIDLVLSVQNAVFGGYASHKDVAPSGVFVACYSVILLAYGYVFTKNMKRGHKFWLHLGIMFYCICRIIGFGLRIGWAKDATKIDVGLASTVFIIISTVILASFNLLLAHRMFSWRHPELGTSLLLNTFLGILYSIVVGLCVMAVIGAVVPYLYFLSEHRYYMCKQVQQAAGVFVIIYDTTALAMVSIAYVAPPGKLAVFSRTKKKNKGLIPTVYSPFWIRSFSTFYYVEKGSQVIVYKKMPKSMLADNGSTKGDEDDHNPMADAMRVITSSDHPTQSINTHMVPDFEAYEQPNPSQLGLKHNTSVLLIVLTSVLLLIGACFRAASLFMNEMNGGAAGIPECSWIYKPVVMYVLYGALELIVLVLWLIFRIDLRFYVPDRPRKGYPPETYDGSMVQHILTHTSTNVTQTSTQDLPPQKDAYPTFSENSEKPLNDLEPRGTQDTVN